MNGEADDIVPVLRYMEHLRAGHAVSLENAFEAEALRDAWNDENPERPVSIIELPNGRRVVSVIA